MRVKGLKEILSVCLDKKAADIVVLDMRKLTSFTDYFVIASADSTVQARAIAEALEERSKKKKFKIYRTEGREEGRWILLDAGYLVLHLFIKETRAFYNLELLWADAPRFRVENNGKITA